MRIASLPDHLHDDAVTLWEECALTRPWNDPHTDLSRALGGPSSTVLAALEQDQLIGTVMVGHDGHRGWVYYLAAAPERRGEGIGRALMDAAEAWLLERDVPKIQFMVRADNHPVTDYYRHLGYERQDVTVLGRRLAP